MDTLIKSFESFAKRHGNTSFFLAHTRAGEILENGPGELSGPVFLTTDIEHAQNYLPHADVVEFLLKPQAKISDFRFFPRSENGTWDHTFDEESEEPQDGGPLMKKSEMVGDMIMDGLFHEFGDRLELHNPDVLLPVCVHPCVQPLNDADALPIEGDAVDAPETGMPQESLQTVQLPKEWREKLLDLPESGAGYHVVTLTLGDNTVLADAVVLNGEHVQIPTGRSTEVKNLVVKGQSV